MLFKATKNGEVSVREKQHQEQVLRLASQGMVLLENDGTLPLTEKGKIALFGAGARYTIKGGTGSGDVNSRDFITVEQGLLKAGYEIVSNQWLDEFDALYKQTKDEYFAFVKKETATSDVPLPGVLFLNPFQAPDIIPVTMEHIAAAKCDTAIFVLSRNSGEGSDRFDKEGDYRISSIERESIELLAKNYEKCIVVFNIGGVIDTKFIKEIPGINAVLLMSQPGNIAGAALANVISGAATPSGKLTTTWAVNYKDYPNSATFSHNNNNVSDEYYEEGIYVGYRYFDTFNVTPQYEFGYGKSYTDFSIHVENVAVAENNVMVSVEVKNIGTMYSGQEVIQVYYSAPQGELEKPYQSLACFGKTKSLFPGQAQMLTLSFPVTAMASYSEKEASYLLEKGTYYVRVGNSSRNTRVVAALQIEETTVTQILSNRFGESGCDEISAKGKTPYSYANENAEKDEATVITIDTSNIIAQKISYSEIPKELEQKETVSKITLTQVMNGEYTLEDLVSQLTIEEMATLCVGTARMGAQGSDSIIGSASATVPGAAGDTTSVLEADRNIKNMILADGPAGLRLVPHFQTDKNDNPILSPLFFMAMPGMEELIKEEPVEDAIDYYQYCTAIPIATMLAQTWNPELMEEIGAIVGSEMLEFGVTLWLAPGMNIHRNPLCGRNFEYYSEDPLVSGICAAATTKGIQSFGGIGTTIKHFAANNQEDNRLFSCSHVSERTLREIYLRGFEICVKASQPMSIMSSYNFINGIHTANNYDLLTAVARDEWEFAGMIMTDWGTTGSLGVLLGEGESSVPSLCIKAGNDLIMPGSEMDVNQIVDSVTGKDTKAPITLGELQACSKRILGLIMQCNRYDNAVSYSKQFGQLETFMSVH